jgi:hypothetical protein
VGSRSKIDLAYIAGFLDGDGSLMPQLKSRAKENLPHRLMFTICFYQDSRHKKPLSWIRDKFGIGYLSDRNDGITELRINGYLQTKNILEVLLPYIRFKNIQARAMHEAASMMCRKRYLRKLDVMDKRKLLKCILNVQKSNYITKRKKTEQELSKILGLTP